MLPRGLLTDEEWAFSEPFVVETDPLRGRPPTSHRPPVTAGFSTPSSGSRTSVPWRDLPPELGNWNSLHRQCRRWTTSGSWDVLLQALADGGDDAHALQLIDSIVVRAHHCAAGASGGLIARVLGARAVAFRPRSTPITNGHSVPIGLPLAPSEAHDGTAYLDLIEERDRDPGILLADRGYDSGAIRQEVRDRGGQPEIPTKCNRCVQHTVERPVYALRNRVERRINRLKNCRRVATRHDHAASSFLGFVQLPAIRPWISSVHAT